MLTLNPHPQVKKIKKYNCIFSKTHSPWRPLSLSLTNNKLFTYVCARIGRLVNERYDVKSFATCQRRSAALDVASRPAIKWTRHYVWAKGCVCVSVCVSCLERSSPWAEPPSACVLTISCLTRTCLLLSFFSPIKPFQINICSSASCYLPSFQCPCLALCSTSNCLCNFFCFRLSFALSPPLLHLLLVFRCGVRKPCQITNTGRLSELSASFDDLWPPFLELLTCLGQAECRMHAMTRMTTR